MQNNIRIPNSTVAPNENVNKTKPTKPGNMVDIIDPTRVTERNGKDNTEQNNDLQFLLNQRSVFQKFLSQLQQTPELSQTLKKIMSDVFLRGDALKNDTKLDVLINTLSHKTKMTPEEVVTNLQYQDTNATKFSGEMFNDLRLLLTQNAGQQNSEFEALLGRFLKDYSNYFSVPHSIASIVNDLKNIEKYMTRTAGEELKFFIQKMEILQVSGTRKSTVSQKGNPELTFVNNEQPNVPIHAPANDQTAAKTALVMEDFDADIQEKAVSSRIPEGLKQLEDDNSNQLINHSLKLLKESVIPLLSKYISKSHDFGRVRTEITQLVDDIARLNMTSKSSLSNSFDTLMNYCYYNLRMPLTDVNRIQTAFFNQVIQNISSHAEEKNEFINALTQLIKEGVHDEKSESNRAVFQSIAHTLLLDNSVYMPLTHLFLPINFMGNFVFTEMWIDKNTPYDGKTSAAEEQPRYTKMFLNFDITELGSFEAVILLSGKSVKVDLRIPSALKNKEIDIQNQVTGILRKNGLYAESVTASQLIKARNFTEVFENLYEKVRGIDVTV